MNFSRKLQIFYCISHLMELTFYMSRSANLLTANLFERAYYIVMGSNWLFHTYLLWGNRFPLTENFRITLEETVQQFWCSFTMTLHCERIFFQWVEQFHNFHLTVLLIHKINLRFFLHRNRMDNLVVRLKAWRMVHFSPRGVY